MTAIKLTGYALRAAIKEWELRRDFAVSQFTPSLKKFPGETKETPQEISARFLECETAIAGLQVAQARYNLQVMLQVGSVDGGTLSVPLAYAIKIIGGRGRLEKMWRSAASGESTRNRYGTDDDVRDPNQIRAQPTVDSQEAAELARKASKTASRIRQAIAEANGISIELEVDPSWFE